MFRFLKPPMVMKLSEQTTMYPPTDNFLYTFKLAKEVNKELREWLDGDALKYIDKESIRRILSRSEAIITLMLQHMEDSIDDGK